MKETVSEFTSALPPCHNTWTITLKDIEITPESLMVFKSGFRRYAVIICSRGDMLSHLTGPESHWKVINTHDLSHEEFFCSLQWATEISGTDCILLIGREILTRFNITA